MSSSTGRQAPLDDDDEYDSDYTMADIIPTKFDTCVFPPREKAHKFLPEGCVHELITKTAIVAELSNPNLSFSDEDLIAFICRHAKKVFAIGLNSGLRKKNLLKAMHFFRNYNITDKSLPILRLDQQTTVPEPFCEMQKLWTLSRREQFYESQWKFLAPVFSNNKFIYKLESDHILPFTWVSNTVREGAFSKVFEVKIHPSHQEGLGSGNFAIKEIHETQQDAEKNWEAEAKALHEITGLKHKHIIQRIAAITKGEKRYFMFAWADGGSLRDYWQSMPRPIMTSQLVKDTLEQLKGLADALHALHHFNGKGAYRHGDLKPENILRFKDMSPDRIGTLKIADMGLAKYHGVLTEFRKSPTSTKAGTVRYEPPETKTTQAPTSRLYDVWSMGCIVFEYMVWLLYGYEQIEKLNAAIQQDEGFYFKIVEEEGLKTAMVHPDVESWMLQVSKVPECEADTALKDLLGLVKSKLLVVSLNPKRALTFDERTGSDTGVRDLHVHVSVPKETAELIRGGPPYRADTSLLCSSLSTILGKANQNESYLFTGNLRESLPHLKTSVPKLSPRFLSPNTAQPPARSHSPAGVVKYQGGLGGGLAPPQRQDVSNSPLLSAISGSI